MFVYLFVWSFKADFNTNVHISLVGPHTRPSLITVSTNFSTSPTESALRDKWPLDSMFEINCQGEITSRPWIVPATHGLQIGCSIYWDNRADITCSKWQSDVNKAGTFLKMILNLHHPHRVSHFDKLIKSAGDEIAHTPSLICL